MANTTDTYWSADAESLHTYAHSIETLGGALKAAPFRGEDIIIPYRPGQVWQGKTADSRVLNLAMWVRGVAWDADNGVVNIDKQLFQANWNRLLRLLWTPGRQFSLTKRFYDYSQAGALTLYEAVALAEHVGGFEPTMMGRGAGKFVVDLKLADPYFYDTAYRSTTLVSGDNDVWVYGNAPTRRVKITVNGARTNPQIRVKSPGPDHLVKYTGVLGSGDAVVLDTYIQGAATTPAVGVAYDSELAVTHSGNPVWLELQPGLNVVNLSSTSGAGVVTFQVKGAWL